MTEALILIEAINDSLKVVQIEGQLDESNIDEKIKAVYQEMEASKPEMNYILDFTKLNYINSKTIGYLTDIYGKVIQGGGKIVVAGAKPNITDILQVVGLTQLLEIHPTLQEAKTAMNATDPTAPPVEISTSTPATTPPPSQPQPAQEPVQSQPPAPQAPQAPAPEAIQPLSTPPTPEDNFEIKFVQPEENSTPSTPPVNPTPPPTI